MFLSLQIYMLQAGVTLKFPREALVTENSSVPRIQLLTFRSSSFFIPQTDPPHQDTVLRQWVITAVVHGRKLSNLTEPVEITIQNIAVNNLLCLNRLFNDDLQVAVYQDNIFNRFK